MILSESFSLPEYLVPAGAYSSICGAVWFACKRTDNVLSDAGKLKIAEWLREPIKKDSLLASSEMFLTFFTIFFGRRVRSKGFFFRSIGLSLIWTVVLFSVFYTNIKPPYFFRITFSNKEIEGHGLLITWANWFGNIVYDADFKFVMPLITPITYLLVCNILGDMITLAELHVMFSWLLRKKGWRATILLPVLAIIVAFINSYLLLLMSYTISLWYVQRLGEHSVADLMQYTLQVYKNALSFPGGLEPYILYQSVFVLSTSLTICWLVLFVLSVTFSKMAIVVLRVEAKIATLLDLNNKPLEATGWAMIIFLTPIFWILSYWHR